MENTAPGQLASEVRGKDLDDPTNGPPFSFELPDKLSVWPSKREGGPKFNLSAGSDDENYARVYTMAKFDREGQDCRINTQTNTDFNREYERQQQCKEYKIPIIMRDSGKPPMSGTNFLSVIIGDSNDNLHYPGTKRIFVYDYKGSATRKTGIIGTVFAEDKDDWDSTDKEYKLSVDTDEYIKAHFEIIESSQDPRCSEAGMTPGSIILKPGIKPGNYEFKASVKDLTRPEYEAQVFLLF